MLHAIYIHVKPGAKQSQVQQDATDHYTVWVTAQPENNKANIACMKLLAEYLHIAPSRLKILRGHVSRHKMINISGPAK